MRIALDAMGGDFGPVPNLAGARLALEALPQITRLLLVGREAELRAEAARTGFHDPRVEFVHAADVVQMTESAVTAVRRKKHSSINIATDLVRDGQAEAVVSAGHTGAAVAASTLKLRTLAGIDRAGILTPMPNDHGVCYLIDAGANVDSRPEHLVQHAIMGWTYVKHVHGKASPVIGLMSNGEEAGKGNDLTKEVFARLTELNARGFSFHGNVEGRDLMTSPIDVAVCDGFIGNVLLKGCEGTAKAIMRALRTELTATPWRKTLAALLKPCLRGVATRMSYETYGGSPLLGVDGVTIIAHGSSNATAIFNALRVAAEVISHQVNPHIREALSLFLLFLKMPDRDLQPTECLMTIAGTGSYVPERVLTNADLEKMVDTSDEWITTRTGIKERRIAAKGENTSDMATAAALRAMEMALVSASEIELIIVATVTPDTIFPSTACYVQRNLGASNAVAFDISAACSGFLYAMQISRHFINTGNRKTALIIGAEKLSSIVNWSDRNTCVLFGDGAGAAILRRRSTDEAVHEPRVLVTVMGTDGTLTDILNVPGGGSAIPITVENAHLKLNTVHMRGQETFKVAVTQVSAACARALELAGLRPTDIDVIVPHQANVRIIDAAAERLGIPKARAFTNIQKFGNTSAASCAIALDECHRTGVIKPGNYVLIVAFGAGFTWAASVVKW